MVQISFDDNAMSYPKRTFVLILVRHGEAAHNIAVRQRPAGVGREAIFNDSQYFDAKLSNGGILQATNASLKINSLLQNNLDNVYIWSSPLSRTIQTARLLFPNITDIRIEESIREFAGLHFCDSRHSGQDILHFAKTECQYKNVDMQLFNEEDTLSFSSPRETFEDIENRGWDFLNKLIKFVKTLNQSPPTIVAVSHSAYIRFLFAMLGLFDPSTRGLANLEFRCLEFDLFALENYVYTKGQHEMFKTLQNSIERFPNRSKSFPFTDDAKTNIDIQLSSESLPVYKISLTTEAINKNLKPLEPVTFLIGPQDETTTTQLQITLQRMLSAWKDHLPQKFETTGFNTHVVVSKDSQKDQCYRHVYIEEAFKIICKVSGDDKWEILRKEKVHNQNCVVFITTQNQKQCTMSELKNDIQIWHARLYSAGASCVHLINLVE